MLSAVVRTQNNSLRYPKSVSAFIDTTNLLCDSMLALVYPQRCNACGGDVESRFDGIACVRCWQETRLFSGEDAICVKCGVPTPRTVRDEDRHRIRCHSCDDASYTAARACGLYEGALRAVVIALKRQPQVPRRVALLLAQARRTPPLDRATLMLPVPLHYERERQRGFNQSAELGEALARLTHVPFANDILVRTMHTKRHRAGMDAKSRRESVENAFVVLHPRVVAGESVLLIDDVFTTGSTVSACASALRGAGACEVLVLTVARLPSWQAVSGM